MSGNASLHRISIGECDVARSDRAVPTVGVLMSTYNGKRYLAEQIDSIAVQEGVAVELFVRDDGSSDGTVDTLEKMASAPRGCIGSWHVEAGENLGVYGSFERLLAMADGCDYYAFADQDDVWLHEKLACAIGAIGDEKGPALYASSVAITDGELNPIGENRFPGFVYSIPSEFIRHRLAGHTMVWNAQLQRAMRDLGNLPCWCHDQHPVIVDLICGGGLWLDDESHVLHRRLATSATPGGSGIGKRLRHEFRAVWNPGRNLDRAALAKAILGLCEVEIPETDRRFLSECADRDCLALLRDPGLDCGLAAANLEARLSLLLGRF